MPVKLFAAIDVGSSEVGMKIYQISKKEGVVLIDYLRYFIELGSDTYNLGMISYHLVDELCSILKGFMLKIKEYKIDDYLAYGGSALREASNRDLIIDQIQLKTGMVVKSLTNEEQRFLVFKAVAALMDNFEALIQEGAVIVDLGSGSLQISVFQGGELIISQNVRLGSLRIREILSSLEGQTTNYTKLISDYVGNELNTLFKLYLSAFCIKNIIATGEEMNTVLLAIENKKHKNQFTVEQFSKVYNRLLKASPEEISEKYSVPYEISTLMGPAIVVYRSIAEAVQAQKIWTPGGSVIDGVAADYGERTARIIPKHIFTQDIISLARYISRRYHSDENHTRNVEQAAMTIFDAIKKNSGLNHRDRLLLQLAAILHDTGSFINMKNGIENSYRIVMATEIIGLSGVEKDMVADIILYNSKNSVPDYGEVSTVLDRGSYIKVIKMAAILRLANGMDRSHQQKINKIRITIKDNTLQITADTIYDITLEQGLMDTRAHLFEEIYGLKPVLRQKRSV